ncbi:MAG: gamma carbonic anhydrase family protein [Nitrososphaerota archaeon]|nr:gamma carbonic anhydrase family protein [Nitrososphaerota archaeon]
MPILSYRGVYPRISQDCFIAENSTLVGDVIVSEGSSVWFGASLRAEAAHIRIGKRTNIQDNCTVHTDIGFPSEIGNGVTVGHGAILHGTMVGSNCLIGMGAILLNGSKVGNNCLVGAGALVPQGASIPDGSLVVGSPAVPKRKLNDEEVKKLSENADHYCNFRAEYLAMSKSKTRIEGNPI